MEQKFSRDSWQWNFFQEYWKFVQKYYIPEAADEWWNEVIQEADLLYKKYKNDFVKDMIVTFMNDLDKRDKLERSKRLTGQ